jgi:hypothetical protein
MQWTITFNEEKRYHEVVTRGNVDKDGSMDMSKAIAQAMKQTETTRVLIDHRNISVVAGRRVDVGSRPDEHAELGLTEAIKVAVVVKAEHRQFFNYLQTVCVIRGYTFSVFEDKEEAIQWLLKT